MTDMLTFGVLDAVQLGRGNIVSASTSSGALPEDGTEPWSAAEAYAVGDLRHREATGEVYIRVAAGTTPNPPEVDPINWRPLRPTNKMAPFDLYRSTQAVGNDELTYVLRPQEIVSEVWLGGLEATSATITVADGPGGPTIFGPHDVALDGEGVHDWQAFFLAPVRLQESCYVSGIPMATDPVVTITLSNPGGTARLGAIQMGRFIGIGVTEYGAEFSVIPYSYRKFAEDGTYTYVKRPSGGEISTPVFVEPDNATLVRDLLLRYESVPALWIGHSADQYSPLRGFGVFEGSLRYDNYGQCTLTGRIQSMI